MSSASPSSARCNHPFEMSMAINALEAARCNHPFEMSMAINALEAAATPAVLKEELSSASSPLHASAPASGPASKLASGTRSSPYKPSAATSHTSPAWPSPYAQAMHLVRRPPSRSAVLGTARQLRGAVVDAVGSARAGSGTATDGRRGGRFNFPTRRPSSREIREIIVGAHGCRRQCQRWQGGRGRPTSSRTDGER